MEMDWSLDYCLTCDRQTAGEAYCSQVCRLADLDSSACGSEPASPTTENIPLTSWSSSGKTPHAGFHLPPAFDFSAYRSHTPLSSLAIRTPAAGSRFTRNSKSCETISPRTLTPSSSRTSLNSMHSISVSNDSISNQARDELRDYTNSFDQVRDWRRRMTAS